MIKSTLFKEKKTRYISGKRVQKIVSHVCRKEKRSQTELSFVIIDDRRMKRLNAQFLHHHYTTDVITFPFGNDPIAAEVYINVDQAVRQAKIYNVTIENELSRLVVHGTLHALGYSDKTTKAQQLMMRLQERYVTEVSS